MTEKPLEWKMKEKIEKEIRKKLTWIKREMKSEIRAIEKALKELKESVEDDPGGVCAYLETDRIAKKISYILQLRMAACHLSKVLEDEQRN